MPTLQLSRSLRAHPWAPALLLIVLAACSGTEARSSLAERIQEPIVGLPCEGCEAVFQGLPGIPASRARIALPDEPGEALRIEGTVRDAGGRPSAGVIVYAYHTDARGIYPRDERFPGLAAERHGRLRGWARSDEQGRYSFDTIRPASYPSTTIPQHVHMHVIEPGRCTYYVDDLLFDDDPHLTAQERQRVQGRGGAGIATPSKDTSGTWIAKRDIVLGENVPGYPPTAR